MSPKKSAKPRKGNGKKPSERRKIFVAEYLIDRNATRAAKAAGYSEKTAREQGYRLLTDPEIRAQVQAATEARIQRTEVTADRVIEELGRIAFLDLRLAYSPTGSLLSPQEMPEDVARAIAGIDCEELFEYVTGERLWQGYTKKLKPCDKVKALELLAKHFKLLTEKHEHDVSPGLAAALTAAQNRVNQALPQLKTDSGKIPAPAETAPEMPEVSSG